MLSNQSIKIRIWFINCRIIYSLVQSYSADRTISLIVFLFICSTYLFNNCTSQHLSIYLSICSTSHSSSAIARAFFSLQSEKDSEIYAFVSQIDAFSSTSFKKVFRLHFFIYLLDIASFFSNRSSIHLHYSSRYLTKTHAFARQIDAFSSSSFRKLLNSFDIELFNLLVMKSSIFAFSSNSKYLDCNITLDISHSITISISSSLKSLFTYDERLASLKLCLRFLETTRHFKTIMIVVDFSEDENHSNFNYMQCFICSLLLYNEYFTFESLKKHLQNASHCSLALQLQQEVESKIVEKSKIESFSVSVSFVKFLSTYEKR